MRRTIINIILATDMCDHSRLTKVLPAVHPTIIAAVYVLLGYATMSSATECPILPEKHALRHAFSCMPLLDSNLTVQQPR